MNTRVKYCLVLALAVSGCGPRSRPVDGGVRVVSLAPNLTEIVCALGAEDCLVGRSSACDYPPAVVTNIPVVGGFGVPSLEALVAARPTLVLEVDLEDEGMAQQLALAGIARERIPCRLIGDIPGAIRRVGEITGRQVAAARMAGHLQARIERLRREAASVDRRPDVYVEVWHDPPMTAGRRTFLSELIGLAGGTNIGDSVDKEYFEVSAEWVIVRDPRVVICTYMSETEDAARLFLKRAGWSGVSAVRAGAVFAGLDNDVVLRPGPRVLEGIEALRQCMVNPRPR